ncbi:McrC family protein [Roseinatronobacter monicus]|uniref:5-methylcytosine-specific restriction enzyme subunit McrC n=1 Tax=Roseinatronobacter monicus TaxID=393481 RepID=A0A543KBC4_9RHOB|nr:McrC family protein [Roseinatronobacter monicus]TQM92393.1 5-methylcytosine-specific restriction enzyme subunit McrC [Roseinatronobacter monicus]
MAGITIYEFCALVSQDSGATESEELREIPPSVFDWLEVQALAASDKGTHAWLRLTQKRGQRAIQVASFVGVIRAPNGYQIEVLPKVGKFTEGGDVQARQLLIEMLRCLGVFRHIQTDSAKLAATRMPLLEVFIEAFLVCVEQIVKRGLRSDYSALQDNMSALRGKLQMAAHLRHNLCRRDRFFAEFDDFSPDRAENRLLHAALRQVLSWTGSQTNQRLARELCFVFADVPISELPSVDLLRVRLDRGMAHYSDALAWARLILQHESPLTGTGRNRSPSLLFPMEAVFEAFVAKHLERQLSPPFRLKQHVKTFSLVRHLEQNWFRLKPDFLVKASGSNCLVLDAKWKLLDIKKKSTGTGKYGLSQADFYQLYAYGQSYLDGHGDIVLVYPKTETFRRALPVFEFPKSNGLYLWVLPFCLHERVLMLPPSGTCERLDNLFRCDVSPSFDPT